MNGFNPTHHVFGKSGYSAILLRIFTDYSIFVHINALVKENIGCIMNNMK